MARRIAFTQNQGIREKIQASAITNRLEKHVKGEIELSPTQVAAAKILLAKTIPDLSSIELTGDPAKPIHLLAETSQQTLARHEMNILKKHQQLVEKK